MPRDGCALPPLGTNTKLWTHDWELSLFRWRMFSWMLFQQMQRWFKENGNLFGLIISMWNFHVKMAKYVKFFNWSPGFLLYWIIVNLGPVRPQNNLQHPTLHKHGRHKLSWDNYTVVTPQERMWVNWVQHFLDILNFWEFGLGKAKKPLVKPFNTHFAQMWPLMGGLEQTCRCWHHR